MFRFVHLTCVYIYVTNSEYEVSSSFIVLSVLCRVQHCLMCSFLPLFMFGISSDLCEAYKNILYKNGKAELANNDIITKIGDAA